jgi:hypothetical protein
MQGDVLVLDANAEHVARRRELRLGYEMTVNTNDRLHPPKAGVGGRTCWPIRMTSTVARDKNRWRRRW